MAARKWTPEQRAAQSAAIRTWQPWQYSTGAKTVEGKAIVSRNAYRGGMRPFLRLINEAAKAFSNLDTLTIERAESLNKRMTDLYDEPYSRRSSKARS
jgi:hypothetical protein